MCSQIIYVSYNRVGTIDRLHKGYLSIALELGFGSASPGGIPDIVARWFWGGVISGLIPLGDELFNRPFHGLDVFGKGRYVCDLTLVIFSFETFRGSGFLLAFALCYYLFFIRVLHRGPFVIVAGPDCTISGVNRISVATDAC